MSKVGIVTVLYNSQRVLEEFFESLNNQTYKDFTLYLIDNNSPDKSLIIARNLAKKVSFSCVFIPEKENWGVAKGNNIGIKAALDDQCQYILLSNNDVVLNNSNTIETLVNKMDTTHVDILCPKIYYYTDPTLVWAAGGDFINSDTTTKHFGSKKKDEGQFDEEMYIRYTPTCFVLIRRDVFNKIGIMDERYFVYYDDSDFMYRAINHDLKILYTPATSLLHNESSSTGSQSPFQIYYMERNRLIFTKKHRPNKIFWFLVLQRFFAFSLKHIWTMPKVLWKAELSGIIDGIKQRK